MKHHKKHKYIFLEVIEFTKNCLTWAFSDLSGAARALPNVRSRNKNPIWNRDMSCLQFLSHVWWGYFHKKNRNLATRTQLYHLIDICWNKVFHDICFSLYLIYVSTYQQKFASMFCAHFCKYRNWHIETSMFLNTLVEMIFLDLSILL